MFFEGDGISDGSTPTDYLQSDGPPPDPPALPQDPPEFDQFAETIRVPDDYQQEDVVAGNSSPTVDSWDHFTDAEAEDSFHWATGIPAADVIPVQTTPVQEAWDFQDEITTTSIPDSFQQADYAAPVPAQCPEDVPLFDDSHEWLVMPDSMQQLAPESPLPIDGPLFDGTDEDLDELVIDDFPNFTPSYPRPYEFDFQPFNPDVEDPWFLNPETFYAGDVDAGSQPVETGPVFDGADEDLDELVIDDYANFAPVMPQPLEWDWDQEFEDFSPGDDRTVMGFPVVAAPSQGTLTIAGFAPTVVPGGGYSPNVTTIALTGYSPTVQQTRFLSPSIGNVAITGYAPNVIIPLAPATGGISLTGYAPSVGIGLGLTPDYGVISVTGYLPNIGQPKSLATATGGLVLMGYAPTITNQASSLPGVGTILINGYAPTLYQPRSQDTLTGAIEILGFPPGVVQDRAARPLTGNMTITGFVPDLFRTNTPLSRHIDIDPEDRIIDPRP